MIPGMDLGKACSVTREFIGFIHGMLYVNSYRVNAASVREDKYFVSCSVTIPYSSKELVYHFIIDEQGIVQKMERKDED